MSEKKYLFDSSDGRSFNNRVLCKTSKFFLNIETGYSNEFLENCEIDFVIVVMLDSRKNMLTRKGTI